MALCRPILSAILGDEVDHLAREACRLSGGVRFDDRIPAVAGACWELDGGDDPWSGSAQQSLVFVGRTLGVVLGGGKQQRHSQAGTVWLQSSSAWVRGVGLGVGLGETADGGAGLTGRCVPAPDPQAALAELPAQLER